MRILIVNYEYPPLGGGAGNASRFLAEALAGQGHEVSVITSAFGDLRGMRAEAGVQVHRIPARRKSIHRSDPFQMFCFAVSALIHAPKITRSCKAEATLAFFTIPSGLVSYWLKRRCKTPYLVSLRGGDVPGLVPELARVHRLTGWLRRRVLRGAHLIVANSPVLAELSERHDPYKVTIIPNGVDATVFHPATPRAARHGDEFQVLFAGRLQKQKNLEALLDEMARLRRESEVPFTLHVAGDGPLADALRGQADGLGLGGDVVWHGWLPKPELIALYRRVDCFVNPSFYEGMPNTVLEAMACGLPVIASRIAAHESVVEDQKTGCLFSLEDPKQLGRALTFLAQNPSVADDIGKAGRARCVDQFSWKAVAESYGQALEDMSPNKP